MLSFWIFAKDFLLFFRDKKTFFLLILMPLILIAILGAAFSNMLGGSEEAESIPMFNIGVVDEDQSESSESYINDVLVTQLSSMLTIKQYKQADLDNAFQTNTISLAIILPQGFGEALSKNNNPSITLISNGDSSIEQSIIETSIVQYQKITVGIDAITSELTKYYTQLAQAAGAAPDMSQASMMEEDGQLGSSLAVAKNELNARMGAQSVGSFQYYAVAMGVMFLLMTVTVLVGVMLEEKEHQVYGRQFTTRLVPSQYLLGKFAGLFIVCFIQLSIIVVGTRLFLGVSWGDSLGGLLFTMLSFTMSASGFGILVGSFFNKAESFNNIGSIGTQVFAALGGSFAPFYLFPEWMVQVSQVIPNALALQMFIQLMTGGSFSDVWEKGTIALVVGLVLFAVSWFRLAKKGGVVDA